VRPPPGLKEGQFELVRWKYGATNYPMRDGAIMRLLNVSRATFYRWRREIILAIAKEMGLRVA